MLRWLRNRKGIRSEADLLMKLMGDNALPYIKDRSRNMALSEVERTHALAVRRVVEQRMGLKGQVDVATRYLDKD